MRKVTLFLFLSFSTFLYSQIPYTASDYAKIGDEFLISKASTEIQSFDFIQTGENHTWNYANLPVKEQETITIDNPSTTGYKNTWCLSNGHNFQTCNTAYNNAFNLANKLTEGLEIDNFGITNMVSHSFLNDNALQTKMLGGSISIGVSLPITIDYISPDVLYQFPIIYNDTYSNTGSYEIDLNSLGINLNYTTEIIRTNTVEGWGSLTTPFASFTNVLKMKTVVVQNDVITTETQTTPTTRTSISYKWFDVNYGIPVLEVTGEEILDNFIPTSISYIDVKQCFEPTALFSNFPVIPDFDYDTNSATVNFLNLSSNYDSVLWDFGDGNTSTEENPSHTFTCPGIHQVSLTVVNEFCSPNIEDTITLRVNINDPDNIYTNTVTIDNTTLIADRNIPGTTYQWLDCNNNNSPIPGAINQSFTPTYNGSFAVQLNTNGCEDISDCHELSTLSTEIPSIKNNISIYPNPTSGVFKLSIDNSLLIKTEIYNILGVKVSDTLDISNQRNGLYFVKIYTTNGMLTQQIIKH